MGGIGGHSSRTTLLPCGLGNYGDKVLNSIVDASFGQAIPLDGLIIVVIPRRNYIVSLHSSLPVLLTVFNPIVKVAIHNLEETVFLLESVRIQLEVHAFYQNWLVRMLTLLPAIWPYFCERIFSLDPQASKAVSANFPPQS